MTHWIADSDLFLGLFLQILLQIVHFAAMPPPLKIPFLFQDCNEDDFDDDSIDDPDDELGAADQEVSYHPKVITQRLAQMEIKTETGFTLKNDFV